MAYEAVVEASLENIRRGVKDATLEDAIETCEDLVERINDDIAAMKDDIKNRGS